MIRDATKTSLGSGRILADGTVLSERYQIIRLLGVGGMGMVYLAHDKQLNLDVALKVLRFGGTANETRLERFRSELVLARQISHRNVVRIHDIGQSGETHYITMDFVDGESLKHILDLEGALDAARATAIAADLADALAEAHHAEIVHRDVKPANVLIGDDRAYLTDFGIARSIHADGLTLVGEIVGTLDYLAPEQARGSKIDGRADIYALGLLLFEMLTGERPFTGETVEEVLAQRTLANPRDLTAGNMAIPAKLKPILTRCLAVNPDDRYQDAAELATDLRAGSTSRQWHKPMRAMAVAAVLVVAAFMAWSFWSQRSIDRPATSLAANSKPVAVLPFEVAVNNGDLGSISFGLADLLGELLSGSPMVQIVASQRVNNTLRDLNLAVDNLPPSDQTLLGDLLDADYLVVGRLQQVNDTYHVEARLRGAASGEVIYRASYNVADAAGIFATIEPLATELLANLDVTARPAESLIASVNPQAMSAFATGVNRLSQGNAVAAVEPLQAAVRGAPDFALAWDRLAQALSMLGQDREALSAAESAVAALDGHGGRSAALVRARKAALAGEFEDSAAVLERLLDELPDDNEVRFMLAEVYGDAGRLQDAENALQRVIAASPDHPQAWYLLGKFSILQGNARRAADDYLVKALVIQNRLSNDQGKADVLNATGIAKAQLGNAEEASDYYRQALAIRQRIGDERGVAAVLANLARISLRDGRYDEARQDLLSARDKLKDIGDRWTVANLENELGYLEEQRGRFEAALGHYREALRIRDDLGDLRALAESYNNVGYAYYVLGEYDNAAVFNERSLETYRRTDNAEGVMYSSQTKGILNTARGRYDEALKALLESLQISRDIDDAHAEAVSEGYIGGARYLQGEYAAAKASFDNALEKLAAIGDNRGLAEFTLHDAELSLATGMLDSATEAIRRARDLLALDDNAAGRAMLHRIDGKILSARGQAGEATQRFEAALREADLSGEKVAVLLARTAYAARLEPTERISELREIIAASDRLGHGQLKIESSIAIADAYISAERFDEAEAALRDTLNSDLAESTVHSDFRLHALLADVLSAQGRSADARLAWHQAGLAVQRALNAQTDQQKEAFSKLATVRRVLKNSGTR